MRFLTGKTYLCHLLYLWLKPLLLKLYLANKKGNLFMNSKKSKKGGLWLATGSGILALLSTIGCCGFPILSTVLATFGIGSGVFSALKPWQPLFLAIAITALAYEFYKAYRPIPKRATCCSSSRTKQRLLLWLITLTMGTILIWQNLGSQESEAPNQNQPPQKIECSSCK